MIGLIRHQVAHARYRKYGSTRRMMNRTNMLPLVLVRGFYVIMMQSLPRLPQCSLFFFLPRHKCWKITHDDDIVVVVVVVVVVFYP